ncbi:MAG: hypothetical protein ACTSO9_18575 [Candidatus Helarchaeota archaeon]
MNEKVFDKRVAIILIVALLVNSILPFFAHIFIFHFTVLEWLIMNICSPTSISASIALILYIFYNPSKKIAYYLVANTISLFRFAIGGFFLIFGFSIEFIQIHIAHICMIISGFYIFYFVYKDEADDAKDLFLKGVLPGIIVMLCLDLILFPIFFTVNPNIWQKYFWHF